MIDRQIPQSDGTVFVHTFHPRIYDVSDDEIDIWKNTIHHVVGYTAVKDHPGSGSIISLPKSEWIRLMIQDHKDDCLEAVRKYMNRTGITITIEVDAKTKKITANSKSKKKTNNDESTAAVEAKNETKDETKPQT